MSVPTLKLKSLKRIVSFVFSWPSDIKKIKCKRIEESKNKTITKLPVGSAIIANNYFWLHGRKPFKENKDLSRELLRIRGSFFIN